MQKISPKQIVQDLLERSTCRVQVAAVISDRNGIVSWGWNGDAHHAEEHALSRANPKRIVGSTITVAGKRKSSGNFVYARPCSLHKHNKDCYSLLKKKGILTVEFFAKNRWIKEILL